VAAITIAVTSVGAAAAAPGDGPTANTVLGLGFGPSSTLGGALAERFTGDGVTGRVRMGGRVGRLGFEIDTSVVGVTGGDLDHAAIVMAVPTIGYYPLAHPHVQLELRAGLGYGALTGTVYGPSPPPCVDPDEGCPTADDEDVVYPGLALDVGATFQLHLGRRRGGRAILWADAGLSMLRFQMEDELVTGTVVGLTVGIAHGLQL
jgi:hypothetical protein